MTSTMSKVIAMPIYTLLTGEHNEVNMLFRALEATPNQEPGRSGLFEKLNNELRSHTVAEQRAVYDKVKAKEAGAKLIDEAEREHAAVEKLLNELESMDMTSDAWMVKLHELRLNVEHHVREEESIIFDKMHELFSDDEAKDMGKEFRELKTAEMKKLKE